MPIEELKMKLFAETDGSKFWNLKSKLIKTYSEQARETVIDILIKYLIGCRMGMLDIEKKVFHLQNDVVSDLVDLIHKGENKYGFFFEWTLTIPDLTYWGIDGLLKAKGNEAYGKLIDLIKEENNALNLRAKAVKSLAVYSKQPFDKGLPEDPGFWEITDFNITTLTEWQQKGYPNGVGYAEPAVHPALVNPVTELEKCASKLDKKLAKARKKEQDLANPSNWLVIANETDIAAIKQKWVLPEIYLLFVKNFSPLNVYIEKKIFNYGLHLYGAKDLIEGQNGYSYNPVTKTKIEEWPSNFLVIGDDGADPYCIETGRSADQEVRVYTCEHGLGTWDFELFADSFLDFLKGLA